jgi:hypothetical protein
MVMLVRIGIVMERAGTSSAEITPASDRCCAFRKMVAADTDGSMRRPPRKQLAAVK